MRVSAVVVGVVLSTTLLAPALFSAEGKGRQSGFKSLEQLDSAANLLMTISDGDQAGACKIMPSEAKKLLLAIHPLIDSMIDEQKGRVVEGLTKGSSMKDLADPRWEHDCAKACHCGLYASILEGVGEEKLGPKDRATLERLNGQAKTLSHEKLMACAKTTSTWFCKSPLLKRLKKDAKNFPSP